MIRCNLSVLLAERNLRITKVSKDTGISRTTLTSLSSNKAQGIQFDTINTLCNYLNVNPNQLITHSPIDIKLEELELKEIKVNNRSASKSIHPTSLDLTIKVTKKGKSFKCYPCGCIYIQAYEEEIYNEETNENISVLSIEDLEISIELYREEDNLDNEDIAKENLILIDAFSTLPISFINDLKNEIIDKIMDEIMDEIKLNLNINFKEDFSIQYDVQFYWDERLVK